MATRPAPLTVPVNFRTALAAVIHAASKDDNRPILNGVHLSAAPRRKGEPPTLRFAAADNYRIALYDLPLPDVTRLPAWLPLTLSGEGVRTFLKLPVPASSPIVLAHVPEGALSIGYRDGAALNCPALDWQFPNYLQVIDGIGKGIRASQRKVGGIGVNPKYLADLATVAKALQPAAADRRQGIPTLILEFVDPLQPITARFAGISEYREVIMPVRLSPEELAR